MHHKSSHKHIINYAESVVTAHNKILVTLFYKTTNINDRSIHTQIFI